MAFQKHRTKSAPRARGAGPIPGAMPGAHIAQSLGLEPGAQAAPSYEDVHKQVSDQEVRLAGIDVRLGLLSRGK